MASLKRSDLNAARACSPNTDSTGSSDLRPPKDSEGAEKAEEDEDEDEDEEEALPEFDSPTEPGPWLLVEAVAFSLSSSLTLVTFRSLSSVLLLLLLPVRLSSPGAAFFFALRAAAASLCPLGAGRALNTNLLSSVSVLFTTDRAAFFALAGCLLFAGVVPTRAFFLSVCGAAPPFTFLRGEVESAAAGTPAAAFAVLSHFEVFSPSTGRTEGGGENTNLRSTACTSSTVSVLLRFLPFRSTVLLPLFVLLWIDAMLRGVCSAAVDTFFPMVSTFFTTSTFFGVVVARRCMVADKAATTVGPVDADEEDAEDDEEEEEEDEDDDEEVEEDDDDAEETPPLG